MMVSARDQVIETERLRLEPFAPAHSAGLNALDRDPEVMRFIGNGTTRSLEETEASIERVQALWEKLGYSWWAIFNRESNELIGAACLQRLANKVGAPLEIGWRLRPSDRGKGFATEAGRGVIKFAFEQIGASYLVAVAPPENQPSHRVMERLGMTYVGIQDHYDRRCVVYELRRSEALAAET
jgi:RimJ/RimL family protein N-acetyltransferase